MTKHLTLLGLRMTRIFPLLLFFGLAWGQDNVDRLVSKAIGVIGLSIIVGGMYLVFKVGKNLIDKFADWLPTWGDKSIIDASKKMGKPKVGYGCPSCFSEYLEEYDNCPDCNTSLVHFDD